MTLLRINSLTSPRRCLDSLTATFCIGCVFSHHFLRCATCEYSAHATSSLSCFQGAHEVAGNSQLLRPRCRSSHIGSEEYFTSCFGVRKRPRGSLRSQHPKVKERKNRLKIVLLLIWDFLFLFVFFSRWRTVGINYFPEESTSCCHDSLSCFFVLFITLKLRKPGQKACIVYVNLGPQIIRT